MLRTLRITQARDGGYVVTDAADNEGWVNRILFAGTLIAALEYIGSTFEDDGADAGRGPARPA